MPHKQRNTYNFGVSLPINTVDEIDIRRGYYSRSKYILMALECMSQTLDVKKSVQPVQVCAHDQADGSTTQTAIGVNADA